MENNGVHQKKRLFPILSNSILDLELSYRQKLLLLVSSIALLQMMLHLGAMGQYGFHQDELLYISLGKHLSWGYSETPPFIALMGKISSLLLGNSLIAYRIIPAICAGAIVHLTGVLTIRLGGGFFATAVACLSVALSSAFLATGALFIPQVFDEFFWLLSAYLMVRWVQTPDDKYLYILGAVVGVGLLVKYTLIIYIVGLLLGLALYKPTRFVFSKSAFWIAVLTAVLIFLPHLIWQFANGLPALHHYQELGKTQLNYLSRPDFVIQQLLVNGTGIIVWLSGLYYCLSSEMLKPYRFLAVAFIFVMVTLLLLNGKPYYGFGCFTSIFAVGAVMLERFIKRSSAYRPALISVLVIPNLVLAVIVLPYLPIERAAKVFEWTYNHLDLHFPLKWEDQKIHSVNQNYADMIGWEELAKKTSRLYTSLPKNVQKDVLVFADNYGEAGALDYYRDRYPLPAVVSFSSSFALWAPGNIGKRTIIYVSAMPLPSSLLAGSKKFAEVEDQYSRVKGMDIYLLPNTGRFTAWYELGRTRNASKRKFYSIAEVKRNLLQFSKLE